MQVITSADSAKRIRLEQPEYWSVDRQPLEAAHGCQNPVQVDLRGDPDKFLQSTGKHREYPIFAEISVPCRKCAVCLRRRQMIWGARGAHEIGASVRTWFGTLTARPDVQHLWLARARRAVRQQCDDFEKLSQSKQFALLAQQQGAEVTRYIKRVRFESKVAIRYLVVAEAHKSGMPHAHMLLHERDYPVRKEMLDRQWLVGFSKWRLVPQDNISEAFYISKYLAKSSVARVRASASYGRASQALPHGEAVRLCPEGQAGENPFPPVDRQNGRAIF